MPVGFDVEVSTVYSLSMPKFIRFIKVDGVVVGEIVVEADAVEEKDDQLIVTKSGAVVATFVKRSVQSWWITDSPR